jgi:predicted transcriptional regulator
MKVLISIKWAYSERIFTGTKRYEFRKTIFRNTKIKTVVMYVTAPVKQVVGEFDIKRIIKDTPVNLWKEAGNYAGIYEEAYLDYFRGYEHGYAIEIEAVRRYEPYLRLCELHCGPPPRNFCYTEDPIKIISRLQVGIDNWMWE